MGLAVDISSKYTQLRDSLLIGVDSILDVDVDSIPVDARKIGVDSISVASKNVK